MKQVVVRITTDLGHTANFLRELANLIENEGDVKLHETSKGCAEIEWPE